MAVVKRGVGLVAVLLLSFILVSVSSAQDSFTNSDFNSRTTLSEIVLRLNAFADQLFAPTGFQTVAAICGNDICEPTENSSSCPQDCGSEFPFCGNNICESGESAFSCPADCAPAPPSAPITFQEIAPLSSDKIKTNALGYDMDHDGNKEFVMREGGDAWTTTFNVYESSADNTFTPVHSLSIPPAGTSAFYTYDSGDSDGDGLAELLIGGRTVDDFSLRLYESTSENSFPTNLIWQTPFDWWMVDARIADTDNDGKNEIVVGGFLFDPGVINDSNRIEIYEYAAPGVYTKIHHTAFTDIFTSQDMEVMDDLDGDGKQEIVLGGLIAGSSKLYMIENTGDNSYEEIWSAELIAENGKFININDIVYAGDMDGDGKKEFIAGGLRRTFTFNDPVYAELNVYETTGDNSFEVVDSFLLPFGLYESSEATVADVDGDGRNEIIFAAGGRLAVYKSTADNTWEEIWQGPGVQSPYLGAGDVDRDGKAEIITNFGIFESTGSVGAVCGNNICDAGETQQSCPVDCELCGNGMCDPGETIANCFIDCKIGTSGNSCSEIAPFPGQEASSLSNVGATQLSNLATSQSSELPPPDFYTDSQGRVFVESGPDDKGKILVFNELGQSEEQITAQPTSRFIIQLKKESLLQKRTNLNKELNLLDSDAKRLRRESKQLSDKGSVRDLPKRLINNIQRRNKEQEVADFNASINSNLNSLKMEIDDEHRDAITKLSTRVKSLRGNKRLKEYKSSFNGLALEMTAQEVEVVKNLDFVQEVYADNPVYATLMDSAPLIGANSVWSTNITGKGVTIGIIDTGVDYTHPDLGGCYGPNEASQSSSSSSSSSSTSSISANSLLPSSLIQTTQLAQPADESQTRLAYVYDTTTKQLLYAEDVENLAFTTPPAAPSSAINLLDIQQIAPSSGFTALASSSGFDMNNDGEKEYVLRTGTNIWTSTFSVYESTADNSFTNSHTLSIPPSGTSSYYPFDSGDSDGDGLAELLIGGRTLNDFTLRLYESTSANSFPTNLIWQTTFDWWMDAAKIVDTDNDGAMEIVVGGQLYDYNLVPDYHRIDIYENTGPDSYDKVYSVGYSDFHTSQSMEVTDDLDGDGKKEILLGGLVNNSAMIYMIENTADNTYQNIWSIEFLAEDGQRINVADIVYAGDTDGDGKKEFLAGGLKTIASFGDPMFDRLYVFEAVSDNTFEIVHFFSLSTSIWDSSSAAVADIDGDGKNEIIFAGGQKIVVYQSTGDNTWELIWQDTGVQTPSVSGGDIDRDGKDEIITNFGIFESTAQTSSFCGNNICDGNESPATCPIDCELSPTPPPPVACKVVGGWNFVSNVADPMDDHGHGTHVAATVAGDGLLKGIAPDATIYAYKVLNAGGSGYTSDVMAAIERSVDPNQDGDYSDHLDIISMSLGGPGDPDDALSIAIDTAVANGVVAIIAAGNSGPSSQTILSPGTARSAITIAATDKNDVIASFSSRGPVVWAGGSLIKPDLAAPGVSICAAQWNGWLDSSQCLDAEHIAISGTSMATPHVSGVVALLLEKYPSLSPADVKALLMQTANDLGYDMYTQGSGRLDALKAITTPVLVKPNFFEFGISTSTNQETVPFTITLEGLTSDNYTYSAVPSLDSSSIAVSLTPSVLTNGENQLSMQFTANSGSFSEGTNFGEIMVQAVEAPEIILRMKYVLNIDFSAPVISNVVASAIYSGNNYIDKISWSTDDESTSSIFYRQIGNLLFQERSSFGTQHSFETGGVAPGEYEYYLSAENIAGLTTTDDNNGAYYAFISFGSQTIPQIGFSKIASIPTTNQVVTFMQPMDFDNDDNDEFLARRFTASADEVTYFDIHEYEDGSYNLVHSLAITGGHLTSYYPGDVGDSDNDGLMEITAYGRTNNDFFLRIYESSTSSSYPDTISWEQPDGWWAVGMEIADTDNDGTQEIIVGGSVGSSVMRLEILENTGDNSYAQTFYHVFSEMYISQGLAVADDMDGDGKPEILFAGLIPEMSKVYIFESTADNSYTEIGSVDLSTPDGNIINGNTLEYLGDMDGDGKGEFIVGGFKTISGQNDPYVNVFRIFEATADNTFDMIQEFWIEGGFYDNAVNTVDLDGDGKKELVILVNGELVYVFKIVGDNSFQPLWYHDSGQFSGGNRKIGVGDFDKDGLGEIIFRESSTSIYESDVAQPFDHYYYYPLAGSDCAVNITLSSLSGSHTLSADSSTNMCDESWDQTISTISGETKILSFAGLNQGSYAVKVSGLGNYDLSQSHICLIDSGKPSITVVPVSDVVNTDTLLIADVFDNNGLSHCEACVSTDGICDTEWTANNITSSFTYADTSGVCTYSWNIQNYSDEVHTVNLRVTDIANNIAFGTEQSVLIDRTPPIILAHSIPALINQNELIIISVNITDNHEVFSVSVTIDGNTVFLTRSNTTGIYEGQIIAPSTTGQHTIIITGNDIIGNQIILEVDVVVNEPVVWSDEVPLSAQFTLVSADATLESNVHFVWESAASGNPQIYYSQISPSAERNTFAEKITDNIFNSKSPSVDVVNDKTHIVWQDDRDGNKEIYYSRLQADEITIDNLRITFNSFDSTAPEIVSEGQTTHVFWFDNRDGTQDLYYTALDENGIKIYSDSKLASDIQDFSVSQSAPIKVAWVINGQSYIADLTQAALQNTIQVGPATDIALAVSMDSYLLATSPSGVILYIIGSNTTNTPATSISTASGSNPSIAIDNGVHLLWNNPAAQYAKVDLNGVMRVIPNQISADSAIKLVSNTQTIAILETGKMLSTAQLEQTPPNIQSFEASDVRSETAVITAQVGELSFVSITYGPTGFENSLTTGVLATSHQINLTDLLPSTLYQVRFTATDIAGNFKTSVTPFVFVK